MIWNILTTVPQREFKAERELQNAYGLDTVVPYETRQRKAMGRSNKMVPYDAPIMPGYLFVANRHGPLPWRTVMGLRDIRGKVEFDGKPGTLTDAQMDSVRRMAELLRSEPPRRGRTSVGVGDKARIMSGPFESIETLVEAVGIKGVTVSVHMLGSIRTVDIRADQIERAA